MKIFAVSLYFKKSWKSEKLALKEHMTMNILAADGVTDSLSEEI